MLEVLPLECEDLCNVVGLPTAQFMCHRLPEHVVDTYGFIPGDVKVWYYKSTFTVCGVPGRTNFEIRCKPMVAAPSTGTKPMADLLKSKRSGVSSLRQSLWVQLGDGVRQSAEVAIVLLVSGKIEGGGDGIHSVDLLLLQPHIPVEPRVALKPSRPQLPDHDGPDGAASAASLLRDGSRVLGGSLDPYPIDAYCPVLAADCVCLGRRFHIATPAVVLGVADVVPALVPDMYPTRKVNEFEHLPDPGAFFITRPTLLRGGSRG